MFLVLFLVVFLSSTSGEHDSQLKAPFHFPSNTPGLRPIYVSPKRRPSEYFKRLARGSIEMLDYRMMKYMHYLWRELKVEDPLQRNLRPRTLQELFRWRRSIQRNCMIDSSCRQKLYEAMEGDMDLDEIGKSVLRQVHPNPNCRMHNCFNYNRCTKADKVSFYIYPWDESKTSPQFNLVLNALAAHEWRTTDPAKACLFIVSVDTFDRDARSTVRYNLTSEMLKRLPHWNGGRNHIVLNHFPGTYPSYHLGMDLDIGEAMLAQASPAKFSYRTGFDIALPHLPPSNIYNRSCPATPRKLLASFKGKVYLTGKSSTLRKHVLKLHNGKDVVAVPLSCTKWKVSSLYCPNNTLSDSYDYDELLCRAIFALAPRGRRPGTYRLLEVLSAGTVAALLVDELVLPFADFIPWPHAAVSIYERNVHSTSHILRSLSEAQVKQYQKNSLEVFRVYLANLPVILNTMLESLKLRIHPYLKKWPTSSSPKFVATNLNAYYPFVNGATLPGLVVLMLTDKPLTTSSIAAYDNLPYVEKIVVISHKCMEFANIAEISVDVEYYCGEVQAVAPIHRFLPLSQIYTEAVLVVDEGVSTNCKELTLAYLTWLQNPTAMVAFPGKSGEAAALLLDKGPLFAAGPFIVHSMYLSLFTFDLPKGVRAAVAGSTSCELLAMQLLVAQQSSTAPIIISTSSSLTPRHKEGSVDTKCFEGVVKEMGSNPLQTAQLRPQVFDWWAPATGKHFDIQVSGAKYALPQAVWADCERR
eukprot:TRINITY_DN7842_c0_g1_i1.p1 TRINITY_DN7842_c0_g1~~TRINITY_DN7842_c0_g1_i1.p1  ORF type:complete len:753 (-),score=75.75 TRINITY_DN7842_c0_g1_i1:54-2312(-)